MLTDARYENGDHSHVEWFLIADDEVGGWAVASVQKPTSQIDGRDGTVIACFLSYADALHMVEIHNLWLNKQKLI